MSFQQSKLPFFFDIFFIIVIFFFIFMPLVLLGTITSIGSVEAVGRLSDTLEALPASAQDQIRGTTPEGRTAYALAVFLIAPVAVIGIAPVLKVPPAPVVNSRTGPLP